MIHSTRTKNKYHRQSQRHQINASQQIEVQLLRTVRGAEGESTEQCDARVVDISLNGFKLQCPIALGFQEKIRVEFPGHDDGPILATAEVRWVEPNADEHNWSAGCLLSEPFPREYIDQMAKDGVLDRRSSPRRKTDKQATGRWELSPEDFPLTISDVSAQGVRIHTEYPCEIGKRIRIRIGDRTGLTARAVWQQETSEGYLIGCEVTEGSPYALIEANLSDVLHSSQPPARRYQVLALGGLSLMLVMLIRHWFF